MATEPRSVIDHNGVVINHIVIDPELTPPHYHPGRGMIVLDRVVGELGGKFVDGIYTPPPEPQDE